MAFRVELQPQAIADLDEIAAHLQSASSFAVAQRWFNAIIDDIATLRTLPTRCPLAPENGTAATRSTSPSPQSPHPAELSTSSTSATGPANQSPRWTLTSIRLNDRPGLRYHRVMRTYAYRVVVEPDEGGWHAYCPALRSSGAVTQGATEAEAYQNINEVVRMIVDEMLEEGTPLPSESDADVDVLDGPRVAVTI
jgi:predicted RNase H-like HicB family nuclease/plasmid stabilization system protein ParE